MSSGMASDHWRFWLRSEGILYEVKDVEVKYLDEGYLFSGSFLPGFAVPTVVGLLVEKNELPLHTFKLFHWQPLAAGDGFNFNFRLVYEE